MPPPKDEEKRRIWKEKISAANYGKKRSEETRKKIAAARIGRKHSEETRKKMSSAKIGRNRPEFSGENHPNYGQKLSEETRKKISAARSGKFTGENNPMYGKTHSEEARKKMSAAMIGENHPVWNGGCYDYWHNKAWKLFGKDHCKVCGITNEEYKELKNGYRLSMHCTSDPKDYTKMTAENWMTVCQLGCHQKIEKEK